MATVSSVTDLVSQMQQNLDAIHHHLARISDTKAHDDEIQRLENEREKRMEELRAQREQHQHELEEKRKMAAEAAAEKRRAEREKIAARRKQEEDDIAAARRREEEEIAARRKREDEERQARLQQEEEELKAIAQKEEGEREAIHAAEIEKKRLEVEEKETAAQDEVDNQMVILEDEMERKMAEGQKVLKELDEKRKAINAMIDAQMKPSAVTPTFRRGSKRYSGSPLAADVAAMLARKASPPPPRPSGLRNEEHASAPVSNEEQKPREIDNGNDATDLEEAHHEEAPAGEVTSTTHERDSAVNNNLDVAPAVAQHSPEAEREYVDATGGSPVSSPVDSIPTPQSISPVEIKPAHNEPEIPKDLPTPAPSFSELEEPKPLERVTSSSASIRSNNTIEQEDAEDIRAREEMARMNAEIMTEVEAAEREAATTAKKSAQHEPIQQPEVEQIVADTMQTTSLESQEAPAELPMTSSTVERKHASFEVHEDPEDVRAREEMARINAEIIAARRLSEEKAYESVSQLVRRQSMRFSSSQSSPLDLEDVKAREEMERLNAEILAEVRAAEVAELARQQLCAPQMQDVNVTPHQIFPTWEDTAELPVVHGSHGVLAFRDGGADMKIVDAPVVEDIPVALTPFVYDGPQHQLLPTWADTANLPIVSGSHGLLSFRDGGADMVVVETPQREEPVTQPSLRQIEETTPFVYEGPRHELLPTWANTAELLIVSGSYGVLSFRDGGADMVVVEAPQREEPVTQPSLRQKEEITPFVYEGPRHELLPTWANTAELPIVSGSHGVLSFRDGGVDMEVVQAPQESHAPEPTSQPREEIMTPFIYDGPKHQLIPTWQDQSTLPEVLGAHGMLVFREGGADMSVVDYLPQDDPSAQCPEPTKLDPYLYGIPQHQHFPTWQDQSVLPEIRAAHGMLVFREGGADMEPVHPHAPDEVRQESRQRALSSAVPEATWFGQAKPTTLRGHPRNLTCSDSAEQFTTHIPGASQATTSVTPESGSDDTQPGHEVGSREVEEPLPVVAEAAEPEPAPKNLEPIQNLTHTKQRSISERFPFLAARMAAREEANQKESPKLPLRLQEDTLVVEQQARGRSRSNSRNIPNGLGSATMNHGAEKTTPVPRLAPNDMPEDVVVVKGVTYDLEHPALVELVQNSRVDSYWLENQATLPTLKGANGILIFNDGLVSMEAAKAPATVETPKATQAHPYWSANQASLEQITGRHSTLVFHSAGADMKVFQEPVVEDLVEKMMAGLNMSPESSASVEKKSHPYWSADQASLESISGSHSVLIFHDKGADMTAVQTLVVKEVAANKSIENLAEKSLIESNPHPYWSADQASLESISGSHSVLIFHDKGADMTAVQTLVVKEVAANKSIENLAEKSLIESNPHPYWSADQASLESISGSHSVLIFHDKGADVKAVQTLVVKEVAANKSIENLAEKSLIESNPHPYWSADQASLESISGSHSVLIFHDKGADMKAVQTLVVKEVANKSIENSTEKSLIKSNPHPYWVLDQGTLPLVQGTHGMLSFRTGGADLEVVYRPAIDAEVKSEKKTPAPIQARDSISSYFAVNQAELEVLRGDHAVLVFGEQGVDMIAAFAPTLQEKPTSKLNEQLPKEAVFAKAPHPYWSVDQGKLELLNASHGKLVFSDEGAAMVAQHMSVLEEPAVVLPQPVESARAPASTISNPAAYWSPDQSSLEVLRGSYASLHFTDGGAAMHVAEVRQEPEVTISKAPESERAPPLPQAPQSLPPNPAAYWGPDQGSLQLLNASHGRLIFSDEGAYMVAYHLPTPVEQNKVETLRSAPQEVEEAIQVPAVLPPNRHMQADQSQLEIVSGSHGRVAFDDTGASMVPYQLPIAVEPVENPRSIPDEVVEATTSASLAPNPAAYWGPNQADLETFTSSYAVLVFNSEGAAMIPHKERQNHIASQLNSFDHFTDESIPHAKPADNRFPIDDDSDASSVSSFQSIPEEEEDHEIAHLVARDARSASYERDHLHTPSLKAVPELESESALDLVRGHVDEPNSFHDTVPEPEEYPIDEHFHHDAKRNSEHMLFADSDDDDKENKLADEDQDAEDYPEPAPVAHRSSMGPGAFASLVNIVKDNVPLVGQLVDPANGTYSPIRDSEQSLPREPSLHVRTDTADTFPPSEVYAGSHETGSSPITPSDSTASPIQPSQQDAEPVTRLRSDSAWPQRANHEAEFDAYDAHQDIQPKVSTHPTQAEFDPYNPQSYAPALKSPSSIRSFYSNQVDVGKQAQPEPANPEFHLDPRSQYKRPAEIDTAAAQADHQSNNRSSSSLPLRSNSGSRPQSGVFNASQSPLTSPSARPTSRRGTVTDRIGSINTSRSPSFIPTPTSNFFAKTRALFENASSGPPPPEPPRTRPLSGVFHITPMKSKRSSLIQSEQAMPSSPSDSGLAYGDTDDEIMPRSLDANGRPPSPVFRHPNGSRNGGDGDEDFYAPAERHTNPFLGALGSLTNGLSSSIHNPANKRSRETEGLLHGSGVR